MLQCKFQILCHPFEKWDERCINQTVMSCILLYNMMVQEHVNNDSDDPYDNFCGMYDPDKDEENILDGKHGNNNDENNGERIDDEAAEHVRHVEAEVQHQMQIIESHREADRYVYDSVVEHKRL